MDIKLEGNTIKCSFTRMLVFETWLSKNNGNEAERSRQVFGTLANSLPYADNIQTNCLEALIVSLCKRFAAYWKQLSRSKNRVVAKYGNWLKEIQVCILENSNGELNEKKNISENLPSTSGARYRKNFSDCSKRSKRRRLAVLSQVDDTAITSLLSNYNKSESTLKFSADEIVSLMNDAKLTKRQYLLLKTFIHSKLPNVFPSYQKVLEAKKRCHQFDICVSLAESSTEGQEEEKISEIENAGADCTK